MKKLIKAGLYIVGAIAFFMFGGMNLLMAPLLFLLIIFNLAGDSKKDVSDDFARGHVMGK